MKIAIASTQNALGGEPRAFCVGVASKTEDSDQFAAVRAFLAVSVSQTLTAVFQACGLLRTDLEKTTYSQEILRQCRQG